jgi:hypothetical protein
LAASAGWRRRTAGKVGLRRRTGGCGPVAQPTYEMGKTRRRTGDHPAPRARPTGRDRCAAHHSQRGRLVTQLEDAGRKRRGLDQAQGHRPGQLGEQRRALSHRGGQHPEPVLVHQVEPDQGPRELGSAVGDDLPARFLLQPRQFLRRVPRGRSGPGARSRNGDWRRTRPWGSRSWVPRSGGRRLARTWPSLRR